MSVLSISRIIILNLYIDNLLFIEIWGKRIYFGSHVFVLFFKELEKFSIAQLSGNIRFKL